MIKGSLAQIEQQLAALNADADGKTIWLDIEIVTDAYLSELQRRIQELTAELPVEVVLLRRSREQREQVIARQNNETLSELSVEEVFSAAWRRRWKSQIVRREPERCLRRRWRPCAMRNSHNEDPDPAF